MLIIVSKTECLRETVPNGGATDRESSVAELCACALNNGSSRCCRAQAPTTRFTVIEGDEFQNVLRTTTV